MAAAKYLEWLEKDNLTLLDAWARDGLTDEQTAANMGISRSTLSEWKKKYPCIKDALKKNKAIVDTEVENALLKRALGYDYEEISDKYEKGVPTEHKVTKEHVIPDTTAQIFRLKNRKPEEWRDKRSVEGKVDFEADGFMEALKGQVKDTFKEAGEIVET